ncbi:MAG: CHRD domain-containing protein [Lewinellaceae bacterium]|nr:CHRD domain-containing protein [Lewinellaceae bacterium]
MQKMRTLFMFFLCSLGPTHWAMATQHTVTNSGFTFTPAILTVTVGDTIIFQIDGDHNATEVDKATWDSNGSTPNGGFSTPFGGGTVVLTTARTYYYVCTPHASFGMKGQITVMPKVNSSQEEFVAFLGGNQEVSPVLSPASGQVTAKLDGTQLVVSGDFKNLVGDFTGTPAGGSHIHIGYAGQGGGIAIGLTVTPDADKKGGKFEAANNTFILTEAQITALKNRQWYVNVHTSAYGGGEIRGQLLRKSSKYYQAGLFGSQEVPAVMSNGSGMLMLEVEGDTLTVTGAFQGLSSDFNPAVAGGSHLHNGLAGSNGGIAIRLNATVNPDNRSGTYLAANNKFALTSEQKDLLEQRRIYANIHTTGFGGGELRGQVYSGEANAAFWAHLSGANENPSVLTKATGAVLAEVKGDDLTLSGSFSGLEGDYNAAVAGGAHLHTGLAGQNGGIAVGLTSSVNADQRSGSFLAANNQYALTSTLREDLFARRHYLNIHTTLHGGGELRGQLVPTAQYYFQGFFTGTQETQPVISNGQGALIGEVQGNTLTVSGAFSKLDGDFNASIAGGAHLHAGLLGQNGPIIFPLASVVSGDLKSGEFLAAQNAFSLTGGKKDTLQRRFLYANIHTTKVGSGEVRAQLLAQANNYFLTPLSGAAETVPVNTAARGMLAMEVSPSRVVATGSFSGLGSDFNINVAGGAHLHAGLPGQNGGILYRLNTTLAGDNRSGSFEASGNTLATSASFIDTVRARRVYANIHTTQFAGGELRGNLRPVAKAYLLGYLNGLHEVPAVASSGRGMVSVEWNGSQITTTGSFGSLLGAFNPNVAGGAHLHNGAAGQGGGIAVPIQVSLDADSKSGEIRVENNSQTPAAAVVDSLIKGSLYANFHTVQVGSGEIRGQVLPEVNFFPSATAILTPTTGAAVTIQGDPTTAFQATWKGATDPNNNRVVYIWQLSPVADFSTILLSVSTGRDTVFSTTFGTVAALLVGAGVLPGQSITLYHRAVASDGSLLSVGTGASVDLTLGLLTNAFDPELLNWKWRVAPLPAQTETYLLIDSPRAANGQWQLTDQWGRILRNQTIALPEGQTQERINLQGLPSGMYYIQLWVDQKPTPAKPVIIR